MPPHENSTRGYTVVVMLVKLKDTIYVMGDCLLIFNTDV